MAETWGTQPVGFLADVAARIRRYTAEPETNPKYAGTQLYPLIVSTWDRIMDDVNQVGENPIVVRFDITPTTTEAHYLLPPNIGQIIRIGRLEPTTGQISETVHTRNRLNIVGAGYVIEGNMLRFLPLWQDTDTLTMEYIPNGFCTIHMSAITINTTGLSQTVVPLDFSPDEGYFDQAPNAYVGSVLRLLKCTATDGTTESFPTASYAFWPIQERVISSYAVSTGYATVELGFDFDPSDDSLAGLETTDILTYEVLPALGYAMIEAVALGVAANLHEVERRPGPANRMWRLYNIKMRSIRGRLSSMNTRDTLWSGDRRGGINRTGWLG